MSWDDLPELLPGVVGVDADDAGRHDRGGDAQDAEQGLDLGHPANNVLLCALLIAGDVFVEEELIFFVTGELSFIGQQSEKAGCDCRPDDKKGRYDAHKRVLRRLAGGCRRRSASRTVRRQTPLIKRFAAIIRRKWLRLKDLLGECKVGDWAV